MSLYLQHFLTPKRRQTNQEEHAECAKLGVGKVHVVYIRNASTRWMPTRRARDSAISKIIARIIRWTHTRQFFVSANHLFEERSTMKKRRHLRRTRKSTMKNARISSSSSRLVEVQKKIQKMKSGIQFIRGRTFLNGTCVRYPRTHALANIIKQPFYWQQIKCKKNTLGKFVKMR